MRRATFRTGFMFATCGLILSPIGAVELRAAEGKEAAEGIEANDANEPDEAEEPDRELRWSSTIFGQLKGIHSDLDDNGTGGFFDQYEFTANKDASAPLELGVREASFDWVEDREPLLQLRYESPTSNLGVSGSELDDAFFNQRALLLGRLGAFQLDLDYRRLRTEELRVYPETEAGGGALPFTDFTNSSNRFYRERTGFLTELRWRAYETFGEDNEPVAWLAPELAFRGGYDRRDNKHQLRTILDPGNDWLAVAERQGHEVGDAGVGMIVAPGGFFTMVVDYDYQEFNTDNAVLDDSLPFASTSRSLGFVPSTERNTGQVSLQSRFGERAVVTAGFQATVLEQQDPDTPAQDAVDFGRNKTIVYSTQVSGDVQLAQDLSANTHFKYVYRDHDIDRSTSLFNPRNGTQVDEFLETFQRVDAGAEALYRLNRKTKLALGVELLWIDRDLEFAPPGLGNRVILPENALVDDETLMWTLYGKLDWRPWRGLGIRTELSYRIAEDTGYVTDLDDFFQGRFRANYVVPIERPTNLSFYVRGGTGENSDFSMVEGLGPDPPGPSVGRDYERAYWSLGLSGDTALRKDVTLFASFFYSQDHQSDDLLLSDVQRYFQESVPLTFQSQGSLDFETNELGIVLGTQIWFSDRTDGGASYSFTQAHADYDESDNSPAL
jgi:hypothetical protein